MLRWGLRSAIALGLIITLYALVRKGHRLREPYHADAAVQERLALLGREALLSNDVPVAAVLLNGSAVIGEGHNTVLRDGHAGGHAEVNAVSQAIRGLGWAGFHALDRDSLLLITTYEPCAMCRGMLLEYRIKRVVYLEGKGLGHWMRDDLRWLRYELSKQAGTPEELQGALFMLHPDYPGTRAGQGE
ncbi:MAG: nucleoside deaminase [Flavobacteriales bacterium]